MTMVNTSEYPAEAITGFPAPPATIIDERGRRIDVITLDSGQGDRESLVEAYLEFDPVERAQGIPPLTRNAIVDWVTHLLEAGVNVGARFDGNIVGHATIVPDTDSSPESDRFDEYEWELAIFVLQAYQQAGIGYAVLTHLLGLASEYDIEYVWLTVERWNEAAISLYETVGFETTRNDTFDQKMAIRLG